MNSESESQWPDWLPNLVEVNGDPFSVFENLYAIFQRDFVEDAPRFRGCPVWYDRRIFRGEDKEEGFWHVITRQNKSVGQRELDGRRAECLAWCGAILRNSEAPQLRIWDYLSDKGQTQTYLWLHEWDYVVILEARTLKSRRDGSDFPIYFLVTAFHVDRRKYADLEGRYRRRETAADSR